MTNPMKTGPQLSRALRVVMCLVPALMAGCALDSARLHQPPPRFVSADAQTVRCAQFFSSLDEAVARAGVADAQDTRIDGFPYLRVNRFLGGTWRPAPGEHGFSQWIGLMRQLDTGARWFEIRNLPPGALAEHTGDRREPTEIHRHVDECAGLLMARDLDDRDTLDRLYRSAVVPDDYRIYLRIAGLYPLTSIPFYLGVKRLQEDIENDFRPPLASLPVTGRLVRYAPATESSADSAEVADILRRATDNPLRLPLPTAADRVRLLQTFAPVFEIDVAGNTDRIGYPYWADESTPSVDTSRPTVFSYLSRTRFEGAALLQLNYVVWFPARPSDGPLDLLAGRLDGIHWRVTLDGDGRPLLYDSMHSCGCYHLFIPSEKLRPRGNGDGFEEPLLVPQSLPLAPGRVVLRVDNGSHYLQRAYFGTEDGGKTYRFEDYDSLRSLAYNEQRRRSLFGPDGLVRGSERAERWLFWPMGIENPGAMRQRGRHATAFVGRRHFDEPQLVSRYFYRASP